VELWKYDAKEVPMGKRHLAPS